MIRRRFVDDPDGLSKPRASGDDPELGAQVPGVAG